MRILFVDDDEAFVEGITPNLERIAGSGGITVAKSLTSGLSAVKSGFFDVLILDLKLPTEDGGLDKEVSHGQAAFFAAREHAPGTPVYFLTGSSADEFVTTLLRDHAKRDDVWGDRTQTSLIQLLRKTDVPALLEELKRVAANTAETDQVEIVSHGVELNLNPAQKRVLRIFTRRRGGHSCGVQALTGGLSASRVFRAIVKDARGAVRVMAVGKISSLDDVDDEIERFDTNVTRLKAGAFPQRIEAVRAGAKQEAGAFYRLLEGYDRSLFDLLADDEARAAAVVARVKVLMAPWSLGVPQSKQSIADVRRRLLKDDVTAALVAEHQLSWLASIEDRVIQTARACIHGDLHLGNILVDDQANPILIDFADVDEGAAAIDPITLELCILFHPMFSERNGKWLTADVARSWSNVDRFAEASPYPNFIRECRRWAHETAAGDREVCAAAHAYALRQLKYPGTDKQLALTLLDGARTALLATY